MTITVTSSGTLSEGSGDLITCIDEAGEVIKVRIQVIQPESAGASSQCYLRRYSRAGDVTTFNLPNIQSIEETDTANLTEISTIIYGFDDNFVMDLGTTQKYVVTLKRNQPMPCDDTSSNQDLWSNGHWFDELVELIEGWQNLNCGYVSRVVDNQVLQEFVQTGGFRFHYEPMSGYENLYPVIDRNVFVAGSIGMSYSGNNLQTLNVSLPLAVSTMVRNQNGQPMRKITYNPNIQSISTFSSLFPEGVDSIAPSAVPAEWTNAASGGILAGWSTTSSGATIIPPGALVSRTVNELYAMWRRPYKAFFNDNSTTETTYDLTATDYQNVTYLMYILVGWGGSGGIKRTTIFGDTLSGGAGGSGGYKTGIVSIENDVRGQITSISLKAGRYVTGGRTDSLLTITYADSSKYVLAIDNGEDGTPGYVNASHFGKGGAGGTNGVSGEDGKETGLAEGGTLVEYLNGYRVVPQIGNPIGPFTSQNGNSYDSDPANHPKYGGGGNCREGYDYSYGGDGLVIVCLCGGI